MAPRRRAAAGEKLEAVGLVEGCVDGERRPNHERKERRRRNHESRCRSGYSSKYIHPCLHSPWKKKDLALVYVEDAESPLKASRRATGGLVRSRADQCGCGNTQQETAPRERMAR